MSMHSKFPIFAFGTNTARKPNVLPSSLEPKVHAGSVSYLQICDQSHTHTKCPSFAFGTNGARSSVSFGPNQGG